MAVRLLREVTAIRIFDLKQKEVINIKDCRRLGFVGDVDFDIKTGCIIATGGGAVLRPENIKALRKNGRLYYLDRGLDALIPTPDRPTASSPEAIRRRYRERRAIYESCADLRVCFSDPEEAVRLIREGHGI